MRYKLTYSRRFEKNLKRLDAKEKKQLYRKLLLLEENPFHPSLRTKRIQGSKGLFEASVNMDIRIIWCYDDDKIILLLDIGHHKILGK